MEIIRYMDPPLVALGIGLLWGGSLLAVNRLFGDDGPHSSVLFTGVSHVLLTMAAMYATLSVDVSFMLTGTAALVVIALSFLGGGRIRSAKSG